MSLSRVVYERVPHKQREAKLTKTKSKARDTDTCNPDVWTTLTSKDDNDKSEKMEKDATEGTTAAATVAVEKHSPATVRPSTVRGSLPASAPASSLLPQISTTCSHTVHVPSMQPQILALLNAAAGSVGSPSAASPLALNPQAGAGAGAGPPGITLTNDSPTVRFLATQNSGTGMNRGNITMPVMGPNINMQGWTSEQMGKQDNHRRSRRRN